MRVNTATARKSLWNLVDVGFSSLTNYIAAFAIARSVSETEFGAFAAANLAYNLFIGLLRSLTCEPMIIRYASSSTGEVRKAARNASGVSLALGFLISMAIVGIALALDEPLRSAGIALALVLPGLLVQDALRFTMFAAFSPRSAALNDSLWAFAATGGYIAMAASGNRDLLTLFLVWGLAGNLAAVIAVFQSRVIPRPLGFRTWFYSHGKLARGLAVDYTSMIGASQAALYLTGLLVGIAALGSLRGAQVIFGPITVVIAGAQIVAMTQGARIRTLQYNRLKMATGVLGVGLATIAALFLLLLILVPDALGEEMLGASWQGVEKLLLAAGLASLGRALAAAPFFGLRVLADTTRTLRARRIDAPLTLALGVAGALLGGALGAAWGLAIANLAASAVWWHQFMESFQAHLPHTTKQRHQENY